MDQVDAYRSPSSSESLPRTWDAPCIKYSLISIVMLVALACITTGIVALSGRWDGIGTTGGATLMPVGGAFIGIAIVIHCLTNKRTYSGQDPIMSYIESVQYRGYLQRSEFLAFDSHGTRKLILRSPYDDLDTKEFFDFNYANFKDKYREVGLEELKRRESS